MVIFISFSTIILFVNYSSTYQYNYHNYYDDDGYFVDYHFDDCYIDDYYDDYYGERRMNININTDKKSGGLSVNLHDGRFNKKIKVKPFHSHSKPDVLELNFDADIDLK